MYRGDFSLEGWSHLQFHYCEYLEADRCCKFYYIFLKFNKLHLKKTKTKKPPKKPPIKYAKNHFLCQTASLRNSE